MDKMGNSFPNEINSHYDVVGTLAIGFPYSSGYFSKDLILSSSFNLISMGIIYIILAIVSAMTALFL